MENGDLELGDVDMIQDILLELGDAAKIQDTFQRLRICVIQNEDNRINRVLPPITMAPHTLRELGASSFNPRLVSIGPLHRDNKYLQAFEKHKIACMNNLMRRIELPFEEILKSCVKKAYSFMDEIKSFYDWKKIYEYDEAEIAKMMVVDACFILEFIYTYSRSVESFPGNTLLPKTLIFDLVLLENQIPLFFLDEIYQCTILKIKQIEPTLSLINFICPVLNVCNLFEDEINIHNISISTTPHILGLLHECYKPRHSIQSGYYSSTIKPVVGLDISGVDFEPNQDPIWPTGMVVKLYWFRCLPWYWYATLRMPVLYVHDFTELVLRNLIAYEHLYETRNHITSYALAMGMLVKTQADITKLVDSEVLVNNLGSDEEVADMIKSICKEVTVEAYFYEEEWKKLNNYCKSYWRKRVTWFQRTYFRSPWNFIVLLAGIITFALTLIQTIFTITSAGSN